MSVITRTLVRGDLLPIWLYFKRLPRRFTPRNDANSFTRLLHLSVRNDGEICRHYERSEVISDKWLRLQRLLRRYPPRNDDLNYRDCLGLYLGLFLTAKHLNFTCKLLSNFVVPSCLLPIRACFALPYAKSYAMTMFAVLFYIPDTKTKIKTIGTINFNRMLKAYPKNVSPKLSFQKFFMHQPAIKHINNVLNGKRRFEVA